MEWIYRLLIPAIWLIFLIYWWVRSAGVKRADRVEAAAMGYVRAAMIWGAAVLMGTSLESHLLACRLWPRSPVSYWIGVLILVSGLLFAVQARRHLAGNWSQSVTIKQDHELITSGPYRFARHPIYTGILTGFLGTAIVIAEVHAVLSLALMTLALWIKLRLEEVWMREHFGESYTEYSRRVAALIPGLL